MAGEDALVDRADFMARYLCNEEMEKGNPNALHPLVRYLKGDKPITREMRDWLAGLLENDGDSLFLLEFRQRKEGTRKGKKKAEQRVYMRALELQNEIITKELIDSLIDSTGWKTAIDNDPSPKVYKLGNNAPDSYGYTYLKHVVALDIGRRLTNREIIEIISAESSWNDAPEDWVSRSTVQRYLRGWDRQV